jgi:hypothetical protein
MRKSTPILVSVTVLLIVSLACTVSALSAPTQDINALGTAVMSTMISGATQTAGGVIPVELLDTPTTTLTPIFPAAVASTPSPISTFTPVASLISVSTPTNCRTGPGKVYERVGTLLVGQGSVCHRDGGLCGIAGVHASAHADSQSRL